MGQRPNQNKAAICEKADAFHVSYKSKSSRSQAAQHTFLCRCALLHCADLNKIVKLNNEPIVSLCERGLIIAVRLIKC